MSAKSSFSASPRSVALFLLVLLYAAVAIPSAWEIITHTDASTQAIDQILKIHNLQNEGGLTLDRFTKQHPLLGSLFASPVKSALELPPAGEAAQALHSEAPHLLKMVRREDTAAAWWSCLLLNLSLLYVLVVAALERDFLARGTLFALTLVALVFFVIGVLAPAMVIWTAPNIPISSGDLNFVLQHEVRGIAAIIRELFTSGHWVIGGFLFLFSILTPLTKAALTFFLTGSRSKTLHKQIGELLHAIGKWSMADVFVAGVLLALFALKSQQATKSIPCLGLYYFIGYCLLSMTTTELLVRAGLGETERKEPDRKFGNGVLAGLFAGFLCFAAGSTAYTYDRYESNIKEDAAAFRAPQKVDNANTSLPAK